ncbi:MAG TPA: hypothetical protein VF903_02160 [Nitrospirota bacterium]
MAEAKKLGELLLEAGLIDDFQLQSALAHQRNWGGKLGSVLIDLELIREEVLAPVIAGKLHLPYINLFEPAIPDEVIGLIKPEAAKKFKAVPAKKEKNTLFLAMSNPLDIEAIDAIRFATGLSVKPSLALDSEIRNAIRKYYDGEEVVRKQTLNPFLQRELPPDDKMELIRGRDLTMSKTETDDSPPPAPANDDVARQTLADDRVRIDALITLLIEKGLITHDELARVSQKKMGP